MKIEKGMMFLLNKETSVVGVVKSIKCSKDERYVICVNAREHIWNNKTRTFSDPFWTKNYSLLSEDTLLVINTPKVEQPVVEEEVLPEIELIDGDVYSTKDGRDFLLFELDEPVKIFSKYYHFVGVTREKSPQQSAFFTRNGECSIGSIVLGDYVRWD